MRALPAGFKRVLVVLSLALLATTLAWLVCNLVDEPARPTPLPLALPPAAEPTPLNRALTALPRLAPVAAAPRSPFICEPTADCTAQWLQQSAALAGGQAGREAVGQACADALTEPRFEEPLPATLSLAEPLAQHAQGAVTCGHWLAMQALGAAARGELEPALASLQQADTLVRALLGGSRTLVGHAVAWALSRRHDQAVAAVAALQPAWVAELLPLAAPLPERAGHTARWMASEAAFERRALGDLQEHCRPPPDLPAQLLEHLVCATGIGLLPEATRQAIDAQWLARLQASAEGAEAAAAALLDASPAAPTPMRLAWRNTMGDWLLQLAPGSWDEYVLRQADVLLQHRVLALALGLQAQGVPPAERAAWLQGQPLPAALRGRITLDGAGTALVARPWSGGAGSGHPLRPIRVPLPGVANTPTPS